MKKLMVWMLIFLLTLCSVSALAEEGMVAEAFAFSFRKSVTWESTWEDVLLAENTSEYYKNEETGYKILCFVDVEVSNYSADLYYCFIEEQLISAYYQLSDLKDDDYSYLTEALTYKYETPSVASPERLLTLMNCISPYEYGIDGLTNWIMSDGTYIAIFKIGSFSYIIYFNEDKLLRLRGVYNIAGL